MRMLRRLVSQTIFNTFFAQCRSYATQVRAFDVLFMGRDEFSCLVLEELHNAKDVWDSIRVVTHPDLKVGRRGSKLSIAPLKELAKELDLPISFIPTDKAAFRHWTLPGPFVPRTTPNPSHLLITASFGRILPKTMLDIFPSPQRLNVHPSLLPAYRGAAPIQHTLLNKEKETGVCVVEMLERKKGIDAGSIWGKTHLDLPEDSDFVTLRDLVGREGGKLLVNTLRDILDEIATPQPQADDPNAPRAPPITSQDAVIDFRTMTAQDIIHRYRAIAHQRPLHAYLRTGRTLQLHNISVTDASHVSGYIPSLLAEPGYAVFDASQKALIILCADGSLLQAAHVKQQDRALLAAKEWWNGVGPGMRAEKGSENGPVLLLKSDPTVGESA